MSTDVGRSQSIRILTDVVVKWNSGQSLVLFHINLNLTVRRDGQGHSQSSYNLPFYSLSFEPSMVKKKRQTSLLLSTTTILRKDRNGTWCNHLGVEVIGVTVEVQETYGMTVEVKVTKNVHSGDGNGCQTGY